MIMKRLLAVMAGTGLALLASPLAAQDGSEMTASRTPENALKFLNLLASEGKLRVRPMIAVAETTTWDVVCSGGQCALDGPKTIRGDAFQDVSTVEFGSLTSCKSALSVINESNEYKDNAIARPVIGSRSFEVRPFESSKEMAMAICESFGRLIPQDLAGRIGIWAWLTYVLADVLFRKVNGQWQLREVHRWLPADPSDYRKAQRHLVRMPVLLWSMLGTDADHLLCNQPKVLPEIREQLTSQQDMFSANFQRACRLLYFDDESGTVKRGVGGKEGPGVARRMAAVRQQLDVTWDMTDLSSERILSLLPGEFDAFRPNTAV